MRSLQRTPSRRLPSANPDVTAQEQDKHKDQQQDSQSEPGQEDLPSPRNVAMNWLARREHSRAEIRDKLAKRDYPPAVVAETVAALAADGLVSDERFAESFVAARQRRGQGPVRIRMELSRRGLDGELINLHLEAAGTDWVQLAREVRSKKFGATMPGDYKEKARQMRFLEYRGFTGEQIRSALGDDFDL